LKKNNLDLTYFASSIRLKNRLNNLKLNEIQADSFLEDIAIHCLKEEIDPKTFLFLSRNQVLDGIIVGNKRTVVN
jgi:hypothetical protein